MLEMEDAIIDIDILERKYGRPLVTEMSHELSSFEFNVVKHSMRNGRKHDVTMFIRNRDDRDRIAVIKKPFFPAGAYRAPSGAAYPGEDVEDGILRESLEETGLEIEITRYLLRVHATFTQKEERIDWTTHVFEARQVGGELCPRDTDEIAEAKWATIDEIQGSIRDALLETNWELFRYRVALTDLSVSLMEGCP